MTFSTTVIRIESVKCVLALLLTLSYWYNFLSLINTHNIEFYIKKDMVAMIRLREDSSKPIEYGESVWGNKLRHAKEINVTPKFLLDLIQWLECLYLRYSH